MSIFFSNKPKITKEEYKKVRSELHSRDFNSRELEHVDAMVMPHLGDAAPGDSQPGVDANEARELEQEIGNDPHHVYRVQLSPDKVKIFNEVVEKYLKR